MPKMAKSYLTTYMDELSTKLVCFNQERLPITYHDFRHKSLVRPKSKLKRISTQKLQGQFFTEISLCCLMLPTGELIMTQ